MKKIKINTPYIKLDQLIKFAGISFDGAEAKEIILSGVAYVNGEKEERRGRKLYKGDKVKITGGVFEGAEGYFMRIKGDRRVVVCINGIVAVATAFVHPSLVEKIND